MEADGRPSGLLTLVLTDIEGSTSLLGTLGEQAYVDALAEHRRVLRAAYGARGGVEVDTQGDAFFYVFPSALEALRAVEQGHADLAGGPIRVRVGVHTGEVVSTEEGYAGRELHRAARIAAAGHGGQTVVSGATRALVADQVEGLIALGEHRVKDFDEPVSLYQLGDRQFPPLRTVSNTNLPRPASTFVGRVREREELLALLREGERLVTLSGPGGTGKTRLSLEVGAELVPEVEGGVWWVPLASLRDPALVIETVSRTLGAGPGVAGTAAHIGDRHVLLVLDNLEQVIDAAQDVAALLEACPRLQVVVSSREVLRVPGEHEYNVPSLTATDATELFCLRSGLVPDDTVAVLCARLDHMPLAVEMAAARTTILSPAQVLDRLGQRLDLLRAGRGVDPRQQTLRTTMEWSHDLLDVEEQALFARLAVFRGGAILDAAEAVTGADLDVLQSLVDKSLVRFAEGRLSMLETIRAYAWERLSDRGELDDLRRRHARQVAEDGEEAMTLIDVGRPDMAAVLAGRDLEHANVQAALEWAYDANEGELLLRLVAAAHLYWNHRGYDQEKDTWYPRALERGTGPPEVRIPVLLGASGRAAALGDYERSDAWVEEWRLLAEAMGDEHLVLRAMNSAALNASEQGRYDEAVRQFLAIEERARDGGFDQLVAFALINLGMTALSARDFDSCRRYSDEAAVAFARLHDLYGEAGARCNGAWAALALGDAASAAEGFAHAAASGLTMQGMELVAEAFCGLAGSLVGLGEPEAALTLLGGAETIRAEHGIPASDGSEGELSDRALTEARAGVDDGERRAIAWARGAALSPEELLELARERARSAIG